jgi:hypothetical protein
MDYNEYDELHFWTKNYIEKNCLIRNRVMPGKIPGTTYTWIFYLRNGLFNHEFLSAVSQMFIHKVKHEIGQFNFQISGLETGSTPLLAGIPLIARVFDLNINSFSIRKEQKTYGLLNWIEGMPNEKPVMLIDDLCNSSISKIIHCSLNSNTILSALLLKLACLSSLLSLTCFIPLTSNFNI